MSVGVSRLFLTGIVMVFFAVPLMMVGLTSENSPRRDRIGLFGLRLLILATVPLWIALGTVLLEVIL